jgi:hypothetical protein
MSKIEDYRKQLQELRDWTPFLLKESGLPGPRGNLELAQAFSEVANRPQIEAYLAIPEKEAPENSARVFLVFCAVSTLGRLAAEGDRAQLGRLRTFASDPRWRIREAVAIGLQKFGDAHMDALLKEMRGWAAGNRFEQRAAVAAVAEPRLLKEPSVGVEALKLLELITASVETSTDPGAKSFRVLRQALGYCWSVVVAAYPATGKPRMAAWLKSQSSDVRWIMHENLKKNRLMKMDAAWVKRSLSQLESQAVRHRGPATPRRAK